jgi:hypothetical protein
LCGCSATAPATPNQIGAVQVEFRRLGLDGDRPARLAATAALLGLDSLSSSSDLSMGQAGYLIHTLPSWPVPGIWRRRPARPPSFTGIGDTPGVKCRK